MNKSDAEKIDLILDEHEKTFKKHNHLYILLGNGFFITCILCMSQSEQETIQKFVERG
ncbi:hypothetical protein [Escherichia coli]|uniref:hypothetical protein n=1 Tax=Escherichia coli TaxID=562 RepID=UPI002264C2AB|nr:hypothetical protein [Escherichia coli]MCX8321550.1 hypothetical protein [Escherichia coli]MCX8374907.1 hypothetical protein [Escherichia coli]MCX8405788.1 hypothetical protein [Escherichia coli]